MTTPPFIIPERLPGAADKYSQRDENDFRRRLELMMRQASAAVTYLTTVNNVTNTAVTNVTNIVNGLGQVGEIFVRTVLPLPGTTINGTFGLQAISAQGSIVNVPPIVSANYFETQQRNRATSTAGANQSSGYVPVVNLLCLPGASAEVGGFRARIKFAIDILPVATRAFMGLATANPVAGTEPSSRPNILGVGWDTGETTFQILHNDGAGLATKIDTGVTVQTGVFYEVVCSSDSDADNLSVQLYEHVSGQTTLRAQRTSIITDVPAAYMGPGLLLNTSGGVIATQISFYGISVWLS